MPVQALYLDSGDDLVSIKERLEWVSERQALLVIPPRSVFLREYLDMVLLRRHADSLGLEVGLVTDDGQTISYARLLGFPIFSSPEQAAVQRRRWWRGRRRGVHVRRGGVLDAEDRHEIEKRRRPRPTWRQWLVRYIGIVTYFLTLAILVIASAYVIPGARFTFEPEVVPVRVARQIVADPLAEDASTGGSTVPGRVVISLQSFQAQVAPTGIVEIPDSPARGTVIFVNLLNQPASIPAGTRVSTSAGSRIVFQTTEEGPLPGRSGATVEVEVVAVEPGSQGNVEVNQINRIEGSLEAQLNVRNLQPMSGGGVRLELAVTQEDQERLRAQVLQQIQILALGEMEGQLADQEFLARDSLRLRRVVHETYSHFPGEQTELLALEIRAELQATIVDESQAVSLVYDALASGVGSGFELVPDSLTFKSGEVIGVDGEGRVTFEMVGEGLMAASLALEEHLDRVAGQEIGTAQSYLYEMLPLRDYPAVEVWPSWFGRVPFLLARMQAEVVTEI